MPFCLMLLGLTLCDASWDREGGVFSSLANATDTLFYTNSPSCIQEPVMAVIPSKTPIRNNIKMGFSQSCSRSSKTYNNPHHAYFGFRVHRHFTS
jgi:hypothetical protein